MLCDLSVLSVGFFHTATELYSDILMENAQAQMTRALARHAVYPVKMSMAALHISIRSSLETGI